MTNGDGQVVVVPNAYTYLPNLLISSVVPASSTVAGATISINGLGFIPGLTLSLGGMSLQSNYLASTLVTFTNPGGVPCGSALTLTNPGGQTASAGFNANPVVSSFVPAAQGPAAGGNLVFIIGSGLSGATVTVGGAAAVIVQQTNTLIRITVPPGTAGAVPLVVTSPIGCTVTATYTYL